jgi:DNA-binding Lrp family transcriptional regulator
MKAFVLVNVRAGKNPEVVSQLRKIPGVSMAHVCWGRPDIFVVLDVRDEKSLSDAVLKKIQVIDGIESTDTHIVVD